MVQQLVKITHDCSDSSRSGLVSFSLFQLTAQVLNNQQQKSKHVKVWTLNLNGNNYRPWQVIQTVCWLMIGAINTYLFTLLLRFLLCHLFLWCILQIIVPFDYQQIIILVCIHLCPSKLIWAFKNIHTQPAARSKRQMILCMRVFNYRVLFKLLMSSFIHPSSSVLNYGIVSETINRNRVHHDVLKQDLQNLSGRDCKVIPT